MTRRILGHVPRFSGSCRMPVEGVEETRKKGEGREKDGMEAAESLKWWKSLARMEGNPAPTAHTIFNIYCTYMFPRRKSTSPRIGLSHRHTEEQFQWSPRPSLSHLTTLFHTLPNHPWSITIRPLSGRPSSETLSLIHVHEHTHSSPQA